MSLEVTNFMQIIIFINKQCGSCELVFIMNNIRAYYYFSVHFVRFYWFILCVVYVCMFTFIVLESIAFAGWKLYVLLINAHENNKKQFEFAHSEVISAQNNNEYKIMCNMFTCSHRHQPFEFGILVFSYSRYANKSGIGSVIYQQQYTRCVLVQIQWNYICKHIKNSNNNKMMGTMNKAKAFKISVSPVCYWN